MPDINLFIDYTPNETGKGLFLRRLIPELERLGVSCRLKPKGCDVALGISKHLTETRMPKILRVDGIHLAGDNKKIRRAMKASSVIVYQSWFAKHYIKEHMNVPRRKEMVIYNGADPMAYPAVSKRDGTLMAAHWGDRQHKRLDLHIKYAEEHPREQIFLAGKVKKALPANVTKLGDIDNFTLSQYQAKCKKFVYLADLDWCPNVVVESIVAGMTVFRNQECEAVGELCSTAVENLYIYNVALKYKEAINACGNI